MKNNKEAFDENKIVIIKFVFFVVFIIAAAIFVRTLHISTVEEFKAVINNESGSAPRIYILLFSILPTFFAPITPMAIAAGFVFGTKNAFLYTAVSAFINSTFTFFLSKYFASQMVDKFARSKYPDVYQKIKTVANDKDGFALMAVLRLLPFVPYTMLNYIGGSLGYKYIIFILSTMIGITPGMYLYVNIGANADNIKSPKFVFAIILLLIFWIFVSIIVKKFYTKHFKNK